MQTPKLDYRAIIKEMCPLEAKRASKKEAQEIFLAAREVTNVVRIPENRITELRHLQWRILDNSENSNPYKDFSTTRGDIIPGGHIAVWYNGWLIWLVTKDDGIVVKTEQIFEEFQQAFTALKPPFECHQ